MAALAPAIIDFSTSMPLCTPPVMARSALMRPYSVATQWVRSSSSKGWLSESWGTTSRFSRSKSAW